MHRETSRTAYNELKESGEHQNQVDKIFDIISGFKHHTGNYQEGYTLREIQKLSGLDINAVSGRVNDLKKAHRVVELPKRKCSVTSRTVTPVSVPKEDEEGQLELL